MNATEILDVIKSLRDAVEELNKRVQELEQENAELRQKLQQMQTQNEEVSKEARFYEVTIELASKNLVDLDNYKVAKLKEIYDKYGEDGLRMYLQKAASFSAPITTQGDEDPVADLIGRLVK